MRTAHWAAVLALGAVSAAAAAGDEVPRNWHFTVLLDGKHIGEHDFVLARKNDELVVDSSAHFKVAVALIRVYRYEHHSHEEWRNGCVVSIASHTNDNGKKDFVQGAMKDEALAIDSARGTRMLPGCVHTFAYWDQDMLAAAQLLNAQTGEYQSVTFTRAGVQNITVRGHAIAAQRYALRAAQLSIDVWYSDAGDWVALESKLEKGRTLRYEIQ